MHWLIIWPKICNLNALYNNKVTLMNIILVILNKIINLVFTKNQRRLPGSRMQFDAKGNICFSLSKKM